ncbi:C17orf62 isoform 12 [Pongo abelii]|uniref:Essential for reactive oxygen species protein n=1 Tax=Pongo abelii TaxID=9601 RepID=A0A2J8XZK6_PONAB|nr:C17orf62 isoform 12 [Pongo abelii]
MYLQVETRTSSRLHLKRAPGIRSWSLLVGRQSLSFHRNLVDWPGCCLLQRR